MLLWKTAVQSADFARQADEVMYEERDRLRTSLLSSVTVLQIQHALGIYSNWLQVRAVVIQSLQTPTSRACTQPQCWRKRRRHQIAAVATIIVLTAWDVGGMCGAAWQAERHVRALANASAASIGGCVCCAVECSLLFSRPRMRCWRWRSWRPGSCRRSGPRAATASRWLSSRRPSCERHM